jgi:hypothetical protein
MRILTLTKPKVAKFPLPPKNDDDKMTPHVVNGISFDFEDGHGNKAVCYVRVDPEVKEEKEYVQEIKSDLEYLIFCAEMYEKGKFS